MRSEGEYSKFQKGGYARVLIEIEAESQNPSIEMALNDDPWNDQLRQYDFSNWFEGAIHGVEFALNLAKIPSASVRILRIVGLMVDTIPSNVAAASAVAIWNAMDYEVPQEVTEKMHQAVVVGWKNPNYKLQKFE